MPVAIPNDTHAIMIGSAGNICLRRKSVSRNCPRFQPMLDEVIPAKINIKILNMVDLKFDVIEIDRLQIKKLNFL
jgi:hypothetical protein